MTTPEPGADWFPGAMPSNISCDPTAYIGSSYSFRRFRSQMSPGLRVGSQATLDDGATLDVGPRGRVHIGSHAILGPALIVCDYEVILGDCAMVAWNALVMDTYRGRRREHGRGGGAASGPVRIGDGAWIGLQACILPGVSVGAGTIVGAGAVVFESLPPFVIAAGNPARIIRHL